MSIDYYHRFNSRMHYRKVPSLIAHLVRLWLLLALFASGNYTEAFSSSSSGNSSSGAQLVLRLETRQVERIILITFNLSKPTTWLFDNRNKQQQDSASDFDNDLPLLRQGVADIFKIFSYSTSHTFSQYSRPIIGILESENGEDDEDHERNKKLFMEVLTDIYHPSQKEEDTVDETHNGYGVHLFGGPTNINTMSPPSNKNVEKEEVDGGDKQEEYETNDNGKDIGSGQSKASSVTKAEQLLAMAVRDCYLDLETANQDSNKFSWKLSRVVHVGNTIEDILAAKAIAMGLQPPGKKKLTRREQEQRQQLRQSFFNINSLYDDDRRICVGMVAIADGTHGSTVKELKEAAGEPIPGLWEPVVILPIKNDDGMTATKIDPVAFLRACGLNRPGQAIFHKVRYGNKKY